MNPNFKQYLLKTAKASACEEIEIIQSLWSGYGKISRYALSDSSYPKVVVKHIALSQAKAHPRGWNTDIGHLRKVKSYEVENFWYENFNRACTDSCKIPKFIGSFSEGQDQWIIMEDLNASFPSRKHNLELAEVKVCLRWLANLHATFMKQKPEGLWQIGTYWHLETRPDEWAQMEHQELKNKASSIDDILNNCAFQTIVHGDAKLANFCFSANGEKVAAVDFQYVGGGCGMKDVAYFLGSCLTSSECETHQNELLNFYFKVLQKALERRTQNIDFEALEAEWRAMYPYAVADFARFLLGWMPTHQKLNKYTLNIVEHVIEDL